MEIVQPTGEFTRILGNERGPNSDVVIIAALATWRVTQGVYRFDSTLLDALLETRLRDGDLPVTHLRRLPEWCVYLEIGKEFVFGGTLHGFFALLSCNPGGSDESLLLVLDLDKMLLPVRVPLGKGSLREALISVAKTEEQRQRIAKASASVANALEPLVSALLYLCASDAELFNGQGHGRWPPRPALKRGKKGAFYPAAKRPLLWEVGGSIGAAIRNARENPTKRVAGHIRKAHWHSFWTGPKERPEERVLKLRWLSPILVNVERDVEPRVRHVRDDAGGSR